KPGRARISRSVEQTDAVTGSDRHLVIIEEQDISSVWKHRRDVRGNEGLALNGADNERITFPDGHDLLGIVGRQTDERVQAFQLRERFDDRFLEISLEMLFQKMSDDFGIGLGRELVAFFDQLPLQRKIVLDDAVVGNHNAALTVAMRMRVFFGWTAVRGPARMTEAELSGDRLL